MSSDTRYVHNRAKLTKAEKIFFFRGPVMCRKLLG